MGLTRIEQIGNLRDGRDSARDKPRQDVVANTLNLIRNRAGGFIGWLDTGVAIAFASVELGIYQECEQNANPEPSEVRFCVI